MTAVKRLLTEEEMVKAIWDAFMPADPSDDDKITQTMRFRIIAKAQHDLTKEQYEGYKSPDEVSKMLIKMAGACKTLRENQVNTLTSMHKGMMRSQRERIFASIEKRCPNITQMQWYQSLKSKYG